MNEGEAAPKRFQSREFPNLGTSSETGAGDADSDFSLHSSRYLGIF